MHDKTEQAYRSAEGRCLDAMQSLRRFSGAEAIASLKTAIRTIEAEQARARREDHLRYDRVIVRDVPSLTPDDF